MLADKPAPEHVLRLAETHINRYSNYLVCAHAGHKGYNAGELQFYLEIWQSVQRKKGEVKDLTSDELDEVIDALLDEEGLA